MARKPAADAPRYRLKDGAPPHYIGGEIVAAGAVVALPDGVEPGAWLVEVGSKAEPKADAKADAKK